MGGPVVVAEAVGIATLPSTAPMSQAAPWGRGIPR